MNLDLSYYVSVFLRRLHIFLILAAGVTAAALYVATTLPAMYSSDARLLVEGAQIPDELAASTVRTGMSEQLAVVEQLLMTRENLLEIAHSLDVFEEQGPLPANDIVERMRSRTTIRQAGSGGANLLIVGFESRNPQVATRVASEFVNRIMAQNARLRTNRAEDTFDFFQNEVERLGEELDQQSAKIVEFKNKHRGALPDGNTYRLNRQTAQQERLSQINRELEGLRDQRERLVQVFESGGSLTANQNRLSPEERELQDLRDQLDRALAIYSSSNPRIRILRTRVEQMEAQLAQQGASSDEETDPRRATFDLQMAEIDSRKENLEEQRSTLEAELERLEEAIAATPENAIALDALQRDYTNTQSQYNSSVDRLAKAATGERIELNSKGQRIAVIEQPTVPTEPTSPDRMAIAGGGAFAGIALGAGVILLLELLNQSIRRPVDLQNRLGISPLVTLPYIRTRHEMMMKRSLVILLILAVVIGAPAALFILHTFYPLDLLFERITDKLLP